MKPMDPQWLTWAKRLQAIAQTGLTYSKDVFDSERYESLREIAAEMMAFASNEYDTTHFTKVFSMDVGYATPKVDVRAVVFRNDQLLLVKEKEDGCWTLPGGWADIGDSPSSAVVREVKEESGFEVKATKLLALLDRNLHGHPPIPFHAYKLFFQCELLGGVAQGSKETDEVGFFSKGSIPPLSLTRVTTVQIAQMFLHKVHPEWPTQFD